MAWSHGGTWTEERIQNELAWVILDVGRMPSCRELQRRGRNDLAVIVGRRGGYRAWAARLGAALKNTETHRGNAIEDAIGGYLRDLGFAVERQTTRAPFDFLVDGVRVDVKSGSQTGACSAHTFGSMKVPATCDLYLACMVDGRNRILARYFIPASEAKVRTLSITTSGRSKYERFKEAIDEIRKLAKGARK